MKELPGKSNTMPIKSKKTKFSIIFIRPYLLYRVAPKNGTVDFSGLCSDQQLSFFTLLDSKQIYHALRGSS